MLSARISHPIKAEYVFSTWSLLKKLLADGAGAWNLSQRMILAIWSVPFIIALFGVVTALISTELYVRFTKEDGFGENMQVLFFALTLVLSVIVTRHKLGGESKTIGFLYLALSFGLFFIIGEELSWGQRIFDWETPEAFKALNKQEETNLHNLYGVGTAFKWIKLVVLAYGTILPLIILRSTMLAPYRQMLSTLVPHYTLIPYFLLPLVWRVYRNFFEAPQRHYVKIFLYEEVMELILSIGLFLFVFFQLTSQRSRAENKDSD